MTKDIPGGFVENHKFCTSVHYRNVDERIFLVLHNVDVWKVMIGYYILHIYVLQSWPTIAQYVHDVLKDYPRLRLTHGRKVIIRTPCLIYICYFNFACDCS